MPDICTCGAQLPPDALFCHKCGKPQREIVEPETLPPPPYAATVAPPPPPPAEAPQPGFSNPLAFRIAFAAAVVATLMSFLPYLNWMAAGYFAVFFYRRRTGSRLNMESGVRMGWMTGMMMFAIMALLLAMMLVFLRTAGGLPQFQEQLRQAADPRLAEAFKLLQNGREVAKLLAQLFVFTNLLSMAGGALGARLAGRS